MTATTLQGLKAAQQQHTKRDGSMKTALIALDSIKNELKDKKTVAIIFAYLVILALGIKFGTMLGTLAKLMFLKTTLPVEVVVTYYTSIIWVPLLAVLLSFDSISWETSTKSISYLAIRTSRASIIIGKYISTAIMISVINLLIYLAAVIYFNLNSGESMLGPAMAAWAYVSFYSLAFVSIGFLCSTISKKHQTALWAAISLIAVAAIVGGRESIAFLSPFHYISNIFEGGFAAGAGALTVFAAAGLGLSILIFQRKDIC
ncbi:ABC transporter permease [Candidatus Woesearchaeota archaeon]|nr:ABC transporter permease [Candidatus Woesearchaeota archaeon]